MQGKFITIEGIEGVGKSTNIAFVRSWLESHGINCLLTREPGGTELGEALRSLLLHGGEVSDKAELLMMFAARAQHLEEKIKPALEQGVWVICDRFTDSTYAYQGGGRMLNVDWITSLEELVLESFQPDLTLLLDAPVEIGRARAAKRGAADRIEAEDIAFFNRVRDMFLFRSKQSQRYSVVDATQALSNVQSDIETSLSLLLNSTHTLGTTQ
ncbi:MAG: dTMP kinase [Bermanella sp.]|jgi:dTMP kinase